MDYLTLRPLTKLSQNQRTSQRNNFAEHDYKYVFRSKTTKPSSTKTQSYLFSQSQIKQQPASNSVNLNDHPQTSADRSKNYPFFQQNKNNTNPCQSRNQHPYHTANYFPSYDKDYYNQIFPRFYPSQRPRSYSIDQPDILNQKLEVNKHDNLKKIQHPVVIFFQISNRIKTQYYQPN